METVDSIHFQSLLFQPIQCDGIVWWCSVWVHHAHIIISVSRNLMPIHGNMWETKGLDVELKNLAKVISYSYKLI